VWSAAPTIRRVMDSERGAVSFLILPGIYSSGPDHWQTRWEALDERFRRVGQQDWDHPRWQDWVATIVGAVEEATEPVVLVAHSLGCHAVARFSREPAARRVGAALLVAPPDFDDQRNASFDLSGFQPMVLEPLRFPSLVVASTDDPTCAPGRASALAAAWGSDFVLIGARGHINSESQLGDWPEGQRLLRGLLVRAGVAL
jgi:uncharacterized protein